MTDSKRKLQIEYEATFKNVDKGRIREKLKKNGAKLVYPEFLQKRTVFHLPRGHEIKGAWLRTRKEADRITMSLKVVDGSNIKDQKEICLKIDDYKQAELFLTSIGCIKKAYQENKREKWLLGDVEITIEEWPFLEPYVEVEGKSEEAVREVSKKLGLDYGKAFFGSADSIIGEKYGIPVNLINDHTPLIVFGEGNPFLVHLKNKK